MRHVKTVAIAGALGAGVASLAHAQSSVTLYGIVDPALVFVNNVQVNKTQGAHQYAMIDATTTAYAGSRLGFTGVEDLGGGTSAIFTLENGFTVNNGALGQGGLMFGRQVFVGLNNKEFGTLTFGRQYSPMFDYVSPMSSVVQWGGYITSHPDDLDNLASTNRQNNSVKFETSSWRGLSAGALYSFGGVPGSVAQNQIVSVAIGYQGGPLRLGVGYLSAFDPNISLWGTLPTSGGPTTNNFGSIGSATTPEKNPVFAGYASASRQQIVSAGASYAFASATVGVIYTNTRFVGLGSAAGPNPFGYHGSATFNIVEANATYRLTGALALDASYSYTSASGPVGNKAHYNQVNAGAHYSLSKRTDIYIIAGYQRASGVDSLGQTAVASINGLTPSSSKQQFVDAIGIAHRF